MIEHEEVSYLDVQKKIDDMKKIKESLMREINGKQIEAMNLRDTNTALLNKQEELRKQIASLDQLVVKRQTEAGSLENTVLEEMRKIEAHKRDLMTLRDSVNNEQILWVKDKASQLESLNEDRRKVARSEMTLNTREGDLKNREREVAGLLKDVNQRILVVAANEQKTAGMQEEALKKYQEAEKRVRESEHIKDEVAAEKVRYEALIAENKTKLEAFGEKEAHIKVCYDEIEIKNAEIKDRLRDVVLEEDRLRNIKVKLHKEIQYAALTREKKDEYKKELDA